MTRIAVLDRHPAVRAGLSALFDAQPGLVPAGCVSEARDLLALLYRSDPDVLIVDRLDVVRRAKTEAPRTRILLYVADPAPEFLLAAEVAGADGVIDKAADTHELLRAVRGERVLPPVGLREQARAAARLDPRDRPIFAMRLAGTAPRDIANVVGMTVAALNARVQAIVAQLATPRATAFA
ncbi:response regulator [Solirubrobacter soli]|uniref:response regulator n=1 Tax=Solirubrobacter soli TaxID=363832 RepID=UPI0004010438|nr:response regulator transcription factor [Solirubrobacter soli]